MLPVHSVSMSRNVASSYNLAPKTPVTEQPSPFPPDRVEFGSTLGRRAGIAALAAGAALVLACGPNGSSETEVPQTGASAQAESGSVIIQIDEIEGVRVYYRTGKVSKGIELVKSDSPRVETCREQAEKAVAKFKSIGGKLDPNNQVIICGYNLEAEIKTSDTIAGDELLPFDK